MAGSTGLEPAASGVTGRRSNQLNYDPNGAITQLVKWGIRELVDCIHQLTNFPKIINCQASACGGRYRTRTCDSRRVKPVLYQLS